MDAVATGKFGDLFNSPLEGGIRAVVLLEKLRPRKVDLQDMILLDHVVVHTSDVDGPESLHPALPDRKGELFVRRRLVEASLDLMRRCHLVVQSVCEQGVFYSASDEAASYLDLLESEYARLLKERADWIASRIGDLDIDGFKAFVRERIGGWTESFGHAHDGRAD